MEIPSDDEIESIAMRMHKEGKPCLETIRGWKVLYCPQWASSFTGVRVDPFTGEQGERSAARPIAIPTEFTFGYGAPSNVVLSWNVGDERPPTWFRYENGVLRPPSDLSRFVEEIPAGVPRRRWTLRADNRGHYHNAVRASESPLHLEFHWRPTANDSVRFVGIFRLNLVGLRRYGYIQSTDGNELLLRIVRENEGGFYIQTNQGGPSLLLAANDQSLIPPPTPLPSDLEDGPTNRVKITAYRILRDTELARSVKAMHDYRCQICGHTIELADGTLYAEAHHIQPLGNCGPDVIGNILCVCPNHHAELDYRVSPLTLSALRAVPGHFVDQQYVDYHNRLFHEANTG